MRTLTLYYIGPDFADAERQISQMIAGPCKREARPSYRRPNEDYVTWSFEFATSAEWDRAWDAALSLVASHVILSAAE